MQLPRFQRRRTWAAAALAGLSLVALSAHPAEADPNRGAQATPGTLTCGDLTFATTSGSDLANAIQLTADPRIFVVQSIPEWDFYIARGVPTSAIVTCVLDEPSIGHPITVTGSLVSPRP